MQTELGDGLVWVEATVMPGTEPTAAAGRRLVEAFEQVGDVIAEMAVRVGQTVEDVGRRVVSPDELSVEFGVKVATTGSVIVASGTSEASFAVTITYRRRDSADAAAAASGGGAASGGQSG
jgi:hypothetical protein